MAKGKTKLEKMSKDERTSLAYALATNIAKHGKPQTPKNERKLTKGEENKKEDHVMKFKKSFNLKEIVKTSLSEAEFKHINPSENKIKLAIKDVEKKFRLKANRDNPPQYAQLSLNKIMLSKVLGREELGKEHQEAWEKLKKEYNLKEAVKESDINDPVLVKQRADKMEREKAANAPKSTPKKSINPNYAAVKNASKIKFLEKEKAQLMRDMEQEAEPEGGPIANEYGRKLNRIDNAIAKLRGKKAIAEAKVDYDFSERELIRVLKQLKRGASTEIDMIKAFTKALGRDITKDELFKEVTAKLKKS